MSAVKPVKTLAIVPPAVRHSDGEDRRARCRGACGFGPGTAWHTTMTTIETDPDALLDLIELALTWHELEYAGSPIAPPGRWLAFMESHDWEDPARVERIFSIAVDVARGVGRATQRPAAIPDGLEAWEGSCLAAPASVKGA